MFIVIHYQPYELPPAQSELALPHDAVPDDESRKPAVGSYGCRGYPRWHAASVGFAEQIHSAAATACSRLDHSVGWLRPSAAHDVAADTAATLGH
jgi:hypothetical protein